MLLLSDLIQSLVGHFHHMERIVNNLFLRHADALLGTFGIGRANVHGDRLYGLDLFLRKLGKTSNCRFKQDCETAVGFGSWNDG
jgi:hypothetical protein